VNGNQLRAMLWLRWRLTLNQWRRGGQLNAVITIILLIACLGLAVAGGVAGVVGGALGLSEAPPQAHRATWTSWSRCFSSFGRWGSSPSCSGRKCST